MAGGSAGNGDSRPLRRRGRPRARLSQWEPWMREPSSPSSPDRHRAPLASQSQRHVRPAPHDTLLAGCATANSSDEAVRLCFSTARARASNSAGSPGGRLRSRDDRRSSPPRRVETARRSRAAAGPARGRSRRGPGDLELVLGLPAAGSQLGGRSRQVGNAVDQDRRVAGQVIGQEDRGSRLGQLDHRDLRAHALDREDQPATEDIGEVAEIDRDITTRHVHVIEPFEPHPASIGEGLRRPGLRRRPPMARAPPRAAATSWSRA